MRIETRIGKVSLVVLVAAFALFTGTVSVRAATYYVSQSTGSDDAAGSQEKPWKTLAKASAVELVPGDSILLKCGDAWNEELHPKGNGTPAKPILISAYGEGKKPLIDRQDDTKDLVGIRFDNQGGFKIVGLEFNKCMTGIYGEYSAGTPTHKYMWIEDCYFHDALKYAGYQTYPKPKNISLGICFFSFELKNKIVLSDITIKKCVFRRLASAVWTNSPDNFNKNASFIYNFGNMVFEDCLFEEGYQWQQGLRGVAGGAMRNCVTHDIGRGFRSFNGVAGSMFFRCKDWVIEDCEWGFVDIGNGSGDGEAFDFEGNCDNMIVRNCLFHDTDGPCFLLCCYASDGNPNKGIRMDNCVLNGKAKRPPRGTGKVEILNTTDHTEAFWTKCRFYLSKGEGLQRIADPEKDKHSTFTNCVLKDLSAACSTPKLEAKVTSHFDAAVNDAAPDQWIELDFGKSTMVNEFKIKEAPASSINRYVIQCWDDKTSKWVGCFNGRNIGGEFVAPIVARTTTKARLLVIKTNSGNPNIAEFEAYNDPSGEVFNVPRGSNAPGRVGK